MARNFRPACPQLSGPFSGMLCARAVRCAGPDHSRLDRRPALQHLQGDQQAHRQARAAVSDGSHSTGHTAASRSFQSEERVHSRESGPVPICKLRPYSSPIRQVNQWPRSVRWNAARLKALMREASAINPNPNPSHLNRFC